MITQGDIDHPVNLNARFFGPRLTEVHWPVNNPVAVVEFVDGFGLSIQNRDTIDIIVPNLDDGAYPAGVPLGTSVYDTSIWSMGDSLGLGPNVLLKSAADFNALTFLVTVPVATDAEIAAITAEATAASEGWFGFNVGALFFVSDADVGASQRRVRFAPSTDRQGTIVRQSFLVNFKHIKKAAIVLHGIGVPPRSEPDTPVTCSIKIRLYPSKTVFVPGPGDPILGISGPDNPDDTWDILAYTDATLVTKATPIWSLDKTHTASIPTPIDLIVFDKSGEVT